jgi:ABC-type sugar transport system ATPase subunit
MLTIDNIFKAFPGVQALDSVSFDINKGEIHALVGENGAGKSTLMNIINGTLEPDDGDIYIEGKKIESYDPRIALRNGIFMVQQEIMLMQSLSVAENLFMGKFPKIGKYPILDSNKLVDEAKKFLARVGLENIDPRTKLENLSSGQKQMLQIAKSLVWDAKIVIMDEPSAFLSESETDKLFEVIKNFKKDNKYIIYISHRLEEIFKIADKVTILRDGKVIDTLEAKETNKEELVQKMVGRYINKIYPKRKKFIEDVVISVKNLTKRGVFKDISFELRRGEILGLYGLIGSGRTELALSIYGAYDYDSGEILLNNEKYNSNSPNETVKKGLAYLSEERKEYSILPTLDVGSNITISNIKGYSRFGIVNSTKEKKISKEFIEILKIKTPSISQNITYLSGGNQQKVVLARLLTLSPKVLLLDEPTRGIDVGAKAEIRGIIEELAENKIGIIYISSDLPEVISISDRIMVLRMGYKSGIFPGLWKTDQEIILKAASPD